MAAANAPTMAEQFLQIELELCSKLLQLQFPNTFFIYNPLDYALALHRRFLETYLTGPIDVLFLGMNPGPYGMTQSGVPFGDVTIVKDWLKLSGVVNQPTELHPEYPIWGLDCEQTEESGKKFYGLFQSICGTPENFFKSCFVYNYCPFPFLEAPPETGNITPEKMKSRYKNPLEEACDRALYEIVLLLKPKIIVGVGRYAEKAAKRVIRSYLQSQVAQGFIMETTVGYVWHPSPVNCSQPGYQQNWVLGGNVQQQLTAMGAMNYIQQQTIQ